MPANLPAEAKHKWAKISTVKNPREKLELLKEFFSLIPKHKGTAKLCVQVKRQMAKLRVEMRTEIRRIQREFAITTIYVTHDQEESLSISNRIAVMNEGKLVQIGTPREIYEDPVNKFVAQFIGSTNFLRGTILSFKDPYATLDTKFGKVVAYKGKIQNLKENSEVLCSVRPEAIKIYQKTEEKGPSNTISGKVELLTYLGDMVRYQIQLDETDQIFNATIQNIGGTKVFEIGEKVTITFSQENVQLIPFENGRKIHAD